MYITDLSEDEQFLLRIFRTNRPLLESTLKKLGLLEDFLKALEEDTTNGYN